MKFCKCFAVLALLAAAGCSTLEPGKPTSYEGYGAAMKHVDGYQMAYEWQRANTKAVNDATDPKVLARFVESDEAADSLLARIGDAYNGDPIVLTQIAAVTQLVMCPKCAKAPARRALWVAALKRAKAAVGEGYAATFCEQQLRLCR